MSKKHIKRAKEPRKGRRKLVPSEGGSTTVKAPASKPAKKEEGSDHA